MELVLSRQFAIGDATIGTLTIDGKFQCFTLEDVIRETKVAGKTAIPAGRYPVILCESPRFSDAYEQKGRGRIVPLIDKVPNFKGIRIHVGNKASHSEGCVLVGQWRDREKAEIVESDASFKAMMKVLLADKSGILRIDIRNEIGTKDGKLTHPPKPLFEGLYFERFRVCIPP